MKKDSTYSNRKVESGSTTSENTERGGDDFIVSETTGRDVEFVGGTKDFDGTNSSKAGQKNSPMQDHQHLNLDDEDITAEPALGASAAEPSTYKTSSTPASSSSESKQSTPQASTDKNSNMRKQGEGVKRLSNEQVKEIEKNMYSTKQSAMVTSQDKEELLKKVQGHLTDKTGTPAGTAKDQNGTARMAVPASGDQDMNKPSMAKKTKGLAYFYKNYVQIVGSIEMHDNDDLFINDRCYSLKKKKVSPQVGWGIGIGALSLVMLVLASLFIKDAGSGRGEVTGIVLDEYSQPFVQGATIRFPELGISVKSNPAGFFRSGDIPEGTHKIQYFVNGQMMGEDYATTVKGDLTMVALRPKSTTPSTDEISQTPTEQNTTATNQSSPTQGQNMSMMPQPQQNQTQASTQQNTTRTTPTSSTSSESNTSSANSGVAKLTLAANVPQAKLMLDGKVIGAGNMTFSKLKPGTKTYTVSRDGYQDATGTIKLVGGEEATLSVNLEPVAQTTKATEYSDADFLHSAQAAYQAGDFDRAIQDYSQAIEKKPSYAEAYFGRGEANMSKRNPGAAYDDFIKSAEIYQMKNEYNAAITAYGKATEADKKSATAYLGRANLYLAHGEEIAALADFENVIKVDKRNFDAYYGMGMARYKQGNYKMAVDHLKTARSINEQAPQVHEALVLCYMATSDFKNMKKSWEKFQSLASDNDMSQFHQNANYTAVMAALERN